MFSCCLRRAACGSSAHSTAALVEIRQTMRNRRRSSSTAKAAAAARAYGSMQSDPKLRCPDSMAIRFVGGFFRFVLLPGIRTRFVKEYERRAAGVFFHHQARTKYIDEVLLAELAAGAAQLVLLGAGYDSRAYRFASELRSARVFEVDHPATSAEKQRRVRHILGTLPERVTYVPVTAHRSRRNLPAVWSLAGSLPCAGRGVVHVSDLGQLVERMVLDGRLARDREAEQSVRGGAEWLALVLPRGDGRS